ncbi:hypothetical protein [Streptomyces sp. bgisy027]|uniref:hypothetical protein n=1 Tax=unclassified Streptomyces TaxID=2593676 RepID=UPI003D724704
MLREVDALELQSLGATVAAEFDGIDGAAVVVLQQAYRDARPFEEPLVVADGAHGRAQHRGVRAGSGRQVAQGLQERLVVLGRCRLRNTGHVAIVIREIDVSAAWRSEPVDVLEGVLGDDRECSVKDLLAVAVVGA